MPERDHAYGPVLVSRRLWKELAPASALAQAFDGTEVHYAGEEAVFTMVLNRVMEPHSKVGPTPGWRQGTGASGKGWKRTIRIVPWTCAAEWGRSWRRGSSPEFGTCSSWTRR